MQGIGGWYFVLSLYDRRYLAHRSKTKPSTSHPEFATRRKAPRALTKKSFRSKPSDRDCVHRENWGKTLWEKCGMAGTRRLKEALQRIPLLREDF